MRKTAWAARAIGAVIGYGLVYRPWQLRWGATADEVARELPGDELVAHPQWEATRAVTIRAAPSLVWPWLVQMGASPRAGWYSYDWADNGGLPSAQTIVPHLQHLEVGDLLPMTAGSADGFRVEAIDPERSIVLASRDPDGIVTAVFALRPFGGGGTRLIHRVRFRVDHTLRGARFAAIMELGDFPMSRRTLLGIRQRAERSARHGRGGPRPTDHAPGEQLRFDLSVPVRRPARDVYAALADVQDLEPLPRAAGVRMSKTPAGTTRRGTRWHEQVRLVPGVWMRIESTATEADAPGHLGVDFRTAWFFGHLDYDIEAAPAGSVLHQRETLQLRGPLRPLARQVDSRLRPRLLDRLADVRDLIEARPTPSAT